MENCPPKTSSSISRPSSKKSVNQLPKNDLTISQAFLQAVNDVSRKEINFNAVDSYMQEKFGYGNLKSSLSSLKLVTRSRHEYDVSGICAKKCKSEIVKPEKSASKSAVKKTATANTINAFRPKNGPSKKPGRAVGFKKIVPNPKKPGRPTKPKAKNAPMKGAAAKKLI